MEIIEKTPDNNPVYKTFEELENDLPFDFEQTLFSESLDWKQDFENLDILRKLNKFQEKEFPHFFFKTFPFVMSCLNNLRSNLTKNGLILIKEVLSKHDFLYLNEELANLLTPILFEKVCCEKNFIRLEAKNALQELERRCGVQKVFFEILNKLLNDKNQNICEKTSDSVYKIVDEYKMELDEEKAIALLKSCIIMLSNGRAILKKNAEKILDMVGKKISEELLESYLVKQFEKREGDLIRDNIEKRKSSKAKPKESIKDFLMKKN